jgi:hypothetical protein
MAQNDPPTGTPLHIDKEKQILHPAWQQWLGKVATQIKTLEDQVKALTP